MARINKQEVLQEMQEGLKLDTAREKTPEELAEKVLPVYKVNPRPRIVRIMDSLDNDSDKSFTVPAGKKWKILYGLISLTTTATSGNRRIRIRILDETANDIYEVRALNVQIASTTEIYSLGQFSDVSESVVGIHLIPIPINLFLIEDYVIRIFDTTGVAPTADDMTVRFIVEESDMNPNR